MMRHFAAGPWYPLLFTLAFVLTAWSDTGVSIHAVTRPLLIALGAVGVFLVALRMARLSWPAASVIVMAGIIALRAGGLVHLVALGALAVLVVAAITLARHMWPGAVTLTSVTRLANGIAVALLLVIVAGAVLNGAAARIPPDIEQGAPLGDTPRPARDGGHPDIYLILLDGYPRADTLERLFDYDNAEFLEGLERRGLQVAEASHSNYMFTTLTMASMLHMAHIPTMDAVDTRLGRRTAINEGPVFDAFRANGYSIVSTAAPWEGVAIRNSDYRCGDGPLTDFEIHLMQGTWLMPLATWFNPDFKAQRYRDFVEGAFDCTRSAVRAGAAGPYLVVAHVPSPHLPIVYRSDGRPADLRFYGDTAQELDVSEDEFAAAYSGQIAYLNRRVLDLVDEIVDSRPEAVVIVMSDHGSESRMDWTDADGTDLEERFGTLFAARTPGHEGMFGAGATPVNLFAELLNAYLGTSYPVHPPSTFVSDPGNVHELEEVVVFSE